MKRKKTTATEIVAQAKQTIEASQTNEVLFSAEDMALTRIQRGAENDEPFLRVVFAKRHGQSHVLDLSKLLEFPRLAEPLAEAYLRWGTAKSSSSRNGIRDQLSGFLNFLAENDWHNIDISQLDEAVWSGYIKFLNRAKESGQPLRSITASKYYGCIRILLKALQGEPTWARIAHFALDRMPPNQWPGAAKETKPTESLTDEHMEAIKVAAEKEVWMLKARWQEGRKLLKDGYWHITEVANLYPEFPLWFRVVRCLPSTADRTEGNAPQWGRRLTSLQGGNRGGDAGAR